MEGEAQVTIEAEATNIVDIRIPAPAAVEAKARAALDTARAIVIDSPDMYEIAAGELKGIKARYNALDEQRKSMTGPLREAEKRINDFFRAPLTFLEQAEATVKDSMLTYHKAEEAKRLEAQRLADEAAAAERRRLAAEAAAAEAKAREEAARIAAEIEAKEAAARAEREKAEAEARAAAEAGNRAEAERLAKVAAEQKAVADAEAAAMREKAAREAEEARAAAAALAAQSAMTIAAPVAATPAVKGVSVPGTWTCEVDNKLEAIQYIAEHPEHLGLVEFSQSALNGLARAQKEGMKFPGLRAVFTRRIASR